MNAPKRARFEARGRLESALIDYEHAGPYYVYLERSLVQQFNDYPAAELRARDLSGSSSLPATVRIHDCAGVCIFAISGPRASA